MVCKQLKAAGSLLMLLTVCSRPVPARMQALGSILEAPVQTTAPLGANATFRCTVVGRIFWELDNVQILTEDLVAGQRGVNRYVPLSTANHSEAVLTATFMNNGTVVQCHVEEFEVVGPPLLLNSSEEVSLLVFAEPSLPSNLMVNVPAMGLGVTLSWLPGFAIEGEEVNYVITSLEVATGNEVESQTNTTSVMLIPTSQESTCQSFRFIVRSQNLFSRSTLGLNSTEMLVPTVPLSVDSRNISADVVLEMMPSLTIFFDNLSPCGEYSVENYVLMFSEVDNDLGTLPSSVFNVSQSGSMEASISFMVTSADGLLSGKLYNVTVIASNTAGTSASVTATSTTGLQTVVVETSSSSAVISCVFADGAAGLGCHVSFDDFFPGVNLTRVNGSDIVLANVPFPEELTGSALITVAEILCDGSVSSIKREAVIDIPPTTNLDTPSSEVTSTELTPTNELMEPSTAGSTTAQGTSSGSSSLSANTLYIIIGVIIGVIALLLVFIIMIIVCVVHHHQRKGVTHSLELSTSEELKPNLIYGSQDPLPRLTATTELGGLDGTRQARSNTYDDPQHLAANIGSTTNGGTTGVPTYETVHSAKKEMLNARGPPVLNPVYGPTVTPTSPRSPNLPLVKDSVPNPIYSESGSATHQLPEVSSLSPVYAAVGKSALSDPVPLHYASSTDNHTATSVPEPSFKGAKLAEHPLLPLYEELQASERDRELGDTIVRNESYGLIMRSEAGNSSREKPEDSQ